jgi:hypothetical protein
VAVDPERGGSVQHLACLDKHDKNVFRTFFEIDQNVLIELAAGGQRFIDQGLKPGDVADLHAEGAETAYDQGLEAGFEVALLSGVGKPEPGSGPRERLLRGV